MGLHLGSCGVFQGSRGEVAPAKAVLNIEPEGCNYVNSGTLSVEP